MAQERSVSNRFLEAFNTLLLKARQKKTPKLQENTLRIHLPLPVLLLLIEVIIEVLTELLYSFTEPLRLISLFTVYIYTYWFEYFFQHYFQ